MSFTDAVQNFARDLTANFALPVPAGPEDQLKEPMKVLLRAAGTVFGCTIESRTEAHALDSGGRPDVGVTRDGLLCGHIELKAPGKGARPERFTGSDKRQWEKFKSLPNLIYTDGNEWGLYRSGQRQGSLVRASGDVTSDGGHTFAEAEITALEHVLRDFLSWQPITPSDPKALALTLAPLCRLLREDVLEAMQRGEVAIEQLASDWRRTLFPDADDLQFADAYAQTLTYALLLAKVSGAANLTTEAAATALDPNHGLLAQTLRVLGDAAARAEVAVGVDLLERIIDAVDTDELARNSRDLWLYFYEDFLAAYDPQLRRKEGVYFTPVEVVEAQVRLVTELLDTKFHKSLGFADDEVTFLDPAAGTGAYPLAAITHGLDLVERRFGIGDVPARATMLAQNVHAFENLVGPYAVAHLRISQQILNARGVLPTTGPGVYLTDTLESPHTPPPGTLTLFHRRLSEEHERAQTVKAHTRIIVCMGNPPYDREQIDPDDPATERRGGWVRHGDDYHDPLLTSFLEPARAAGHGIHLKNLYNSYVFFWRWALWKLFETTETPAIVSFITASSYLRGPGFVGMRQVMRETFDELWIIDLEGDNLGARKTENVFKIRTPVAIAIGARYGEPRPAVEADIHYSKVTGSREEKLAKLAAISSFSDLNWESCFTGWHAPFLPDRGTRFNDWPDLTDLFPWQNSGCQFYRSWPIAETRELLAQRWQRLMSLTGPERAESFKESRDRKIDRSYPDVLSSRRLRPLSSLNSTTTPLDPRRYGFRSFDRQWAFPDGRLGDYLRREMWNVASDRQVFLTSLLTEVLGEGPAATVTGEVPDYHHFRGRGGKHIIPLWRDAVGTEPNITAGVLGVLERTLGRPVSAEDLFAYCYGILSSTQYVQTFWDELSVPGLHIPITRDPDLFQSTVELGQRLVWLHTYGERFVPEDQTPGTVPPGSARNVRAVPTAPDQYPETNRYDAETATVFVGPGEFAPVRAEIWNFDVSGLAVLQSWLAYRMRSGAGRRSSPLDDIRPASWTAEMNEELLKLLWILEATVALQPDLDQNLAAVLASPLLLATDFSEPSEHERLPPPAAGALI